MAKLQQQAVSNLPGADLQLDPPKSNLEQGDGWPWEAIKRGETGQQMLQWVFRSPHRQAEGLALPEGHLTTGP